MGQSAELLCILKRASALLSMYNAISNWCETHYGDQLNTCGQTLKYFSARYGGCADLWPKRKPCYLPASQKKSP